MKKNFIIIVLIVLCNHCFSQWQLSLTFNQGESVADISSPTDEVIWTVSHDFIIYKTTDAGDSWKRIKPKGLVGNISLSQLYAVSSSMAFLCVSANTGIGPGLIYKTTDGGHNWVQVFTHEGTCMILIGMFNKDEGLMACSFSSFNGSVKQGKRIYTTNNGGDKWTRDSLQPGGSNIWNLDLKNNEVCLTDYKHFFYSNDRGVSFPVNDPIPNKSDAKRYLQFEDSNYAVMSSGNIVDLLVKRPGTNGWIDVHSPPGVDNGAITGIVLDGNECWMTEAFDTNKLYYSSDSAKTFTYTIPLQNSSFQYLTMARKGKTLVGGTPSFMTGKIYINKRISPEIKQPISFNSQIAEAVK